MESNVKNLSPWRVLGLGSLLLLFVEAVGIVAAAKLGGFGTFFILLFGGFILGGIMMKWIGDWSLKVVAIGFLVVMPVAFGNTARPMYEMIVGNGPTATVIKFSEGIVRSDLSGYYAEDGYRSTRTGGRGHMARTQYVVAPLVDSDWSEGDEIKLWVVCQDTWDLDTEFSNIDLCLKTWGENYGGGHEIEPGTVRDAETAVRDSTLDFNLYSSKSAKYITWSDHPERDVWAGVGLGIFLISVAHLGFVIRVLVRWKRM